jgi:hypothetical protein
MKTKREIALSVVMVGLGSPIMLLAFTCMFVAHAWCVGVAFYKHVWDQPT